MPITRAESANQDVKVAAREVTEIANETANVVRRVQRDPPGQATVAGRVLNSVMMVHPGDMTANADPLRLSLP